MGKKYIIELEEPEMSDKQKYYQCSQMPWWFVSENIVENLIPYTTPDLEQIRKEGYENGFVAGHLKAEKSGQSFYEDGYKRGLADAWEAARKIWKYDTTTLKAIFGEGVMRMDWFMKFTASEAIEKIRQYEQEKQFCVGDEFEIESGKRFVIIKMDGTEIDRYIDEEGKTYRMNAKYKVMRKTGRHFPEIAAVLKKMRGEQDGKRREE